MDLILWLAVLVELHGCLLLALICISCMTDDDEFIYYFLLTVCT